MDGWLGLPNSQAGKPCSDQQRKDSIVMSASRENEATPQAGDISRIAKRKHAQAQMHARDADDAVLSCIQHTNEHYARSALLDLDPAERIHVPGRHENHALTGYTLSGCLSPA